MDLSTWSSLEHKIWKEHKNWPSMKKLLIALSGGADSIALASVFSNLAPAMKVEVSLCHVHHGLDFIIINENNNNALSGVKGDALQYEQPWRDQAQSFCLQFAKRKNLKILLGGPSGEILKSEESLRNFRYQELLRIKEQENCDFILTAHHSDDLLETRLIRLLRGTGPFGLDALKEWNLETHLWRPFLRTSKAELLSYLQERQLTFMDDPSNLTIDPMRNWLRNEILPQIENRQKGMLSNISRSLQLIVDELGSPIRIVKDEELGPINEKGEMILDRSSYCRLSSVEQCHKIAQILFKLGIKNYSQGQIKEIQKRLDSSKKVHNFDVVGTHWSVEAKHFIIRTKLLMFE